MNAKRGAELKSARDRQLKPSKSRWLLPWVPVIILGALLFFYWFNALPLSLAPPAQSIPLPKIENKTTQLEVPLTLGTKAVEVPIHWTAYFVAPVTITSAEKGVTGIFTDLSGVKHRVAVTAETHDQAEIEGVAATTDKQGKKRYAYRLESGVWQELPPGAAAMGNKVNVLIPLLHVAADQRLYPYGSMVYLPEAVGIKCRDGTVLDGYFWVADTGSAVIGNHFDLFVGDETLYQGFISRKMKDSYKTTIYRIPTLPQEKDPKNDAGLAAILRDIGILTDPVSPPTKETLKTALLKFQQATPRIPPAEYGDPDAATTLWFLTQAELKFQFQQAKNNKSTVAPKS